MTASPEIYPEPLSKVGLRIVEGVEAPRLSVVLPAHNEAAVIGPVAMSFLAAGRGAGWSTEVIVVDDGSTDGTGEAVRRCAADHPSVKVVRREDCGGYGRALRTGFEAATGDWIFFTDGDGQFTCDALGGFLESAAEAGLVVGYRVDRRDNFVRRAMGRTWSRIIQASFGVKARDINCAFKLMRRRDVERMGLGSDGALINAEIFHKARRLGLDVLERPVEHRPRLTGNPTGARVAVISRALGELWLYRLRTLWR